MGEPIEPVSGNEGISGGRSISELERAVQQLLENPNIRIMVVQPRGKEGESQVAVTKTTPKTYQGKKIDVFDLSPEGMVEETNAEAFVSRLIEIHQQRKSGEKGLQPDTALAILTISGNVFEIIADEQAAIEEGVAEPKPMDERVVSPHVSKELQLDGKVMEKLLSTIFAKTQEQKLETALYEALKMSLIKNRQIPSRLKEKIQEWEKKDIQRSELMRDLIKRAVNKREAIMDYRELRLELKEAFVDLLLDRVEQREVKKEDRKELDVWFEDVFAVEVVRNLRALVVDFPRLVINLPAEQA